MSYSKKRIEYNNKWPDIIIEFSAEVEFKSLMSEKGIVNILRPIHLPLIDEFQFQRLLSFKIDIYEQLPNRPDIAFDLAWRTFEAYAVFFSNQGNWSTSKTHKILNKVCEDILINQLNANPSLKDAFEDLLKVIPLQVTEFIIRRLFKEATGTLKSQQAKIRERAEESLGNSFITELETKYTPLTADSQRNAGLLLKIALTGTAIQLNESNITLPLLSRMKFLINGLLYSYRNERFHGDSFSPFKSSQTKIKTFAHSYYCLISTYFLITQLMHKHYSAEIPISSLESSLIGNTTRFALVFQNHLKK